MPPATFQGNFGIKQSSASRQPLFERCAHARLKVCTSGGVHMLSWSVHTLYWSVHMLNGRYANALLKVCSCSTWGVHMLDWSMHAFCDCMYASLCYAPTTGTCVMHQPQELFLQRSVTWLSLTSNNFQCWKCQIGEDLPKLSFFD